MTSNHTPGGGDIAERKVQIMAIAYAKAFYGPNFDPFSNPEAYDMAEKATRAALAAIRSGVE